MPGATHGDAPLSGRPIAASNKQVKVPPAVGAVKLAVECKQLLPAHRLVETVGGIPSITEQKHRSDAPLEESAGRRTEQQAAESPAVIGPFGIGLRKLWGIQRVHQIVDLLRSHRHASERPDFENDAARECSTAAWSSGSFTTTPLAHTSSQGASTRRRRNKRRSRDNRRRCVHSGWLTGTASTADSNAMNNTHAVLPRHDAVCGSFAGP